MENLTENTAGDANFEHLLRLTPYQYKQHFHGSLGEVEHYLNIYHQLPNLSFINPINGKKLDVVELLKPAKNRYFVITNIALTVIAFLINLYALSHLQTSPAFLSYLAGILALIGAAGLAPIFILFALDQLKKAHAKKNARLLALAEIAMTHPPIDHITDEFLLSFFADDSALVKILLEILSSINSKINADEMAIILSHLFNDDTSEIAHLLLDDMKFEKAKYELLKICDEGLISPDRNGAIEDPKLIQFLTYFLTMELLLHHRNFEESPCNFPDLDLEIFKEKYRSFCAEFLVYFRHEYTANHHKQRVEILLTKIIGLSDSD